MGRILAKWRGGYCAEGGDSPCLAGEGSNSKDALAPFVN
jgi:hypothetical protein